MRTLLHRQKYIDTATSFLSMYPREGIKQFLCVFLALVFSISEHLYNSRATFSSQGIRRHFRSFGLSRLPHKSSWVPEKRKQKNDFCRNFPHPCKVTSSESYGIRKTGKWRTPGPMMDRKLQKTHFDPRKILPTDFSLCLFSNNNQHQCQA